jgi:hypothetical protein
MTMVFFGFQPHVLALRFCTKIGICLRQAFTARKRRKIEYDLYLFRKAQLNFEQNIFVFCDSKRKAHFVAGVSNYLIAASAICTWSRHVKDVNLGIDVQMLCTYTVLIFSFFWVVGKQLSRSYDGNKDQHLARIDYVVVIRGEKRPRYDLKNMTAATAET